VFPDPLEESFWEGRTLPVAAVLVSAAAAGLVIANGVSVFLQGQGLSSEQFAPISSAVQSLGVTAAVFGALILLFAVALYLLPRAHVPIGSAIIGFALLSLVGGGGYYLGSLLGVVGGVLAILFSGSAESSGSYGGF